MKPFDLIVHHADCLDGVCAAWVALRHSPQAQLHPAKYGDAPPDCAGKRVLVVDFSYPREQLLALRAAAADLLVLDHHRTAAKDLEGLDFCTFDMNRSGAGLAWDTLNAEGSITGGLGVEFLPPIVAPRPWFVSYVEDRDLWRWALPESREISAGLQSHPLEVETFNKIASGAIDSDNLASEGRGILRYQKTLVEAAVKRARDEVIGGVLVPCVESTVLKSEIGERLSDGKPFAAIWSENEKGERVYSLRSRANGMDVSEIAKKYGGGGHARAAGFTTTGVQMHLRRP